MDGLFLIDKPGGMTSFDVVRKMKRAAQTGKVGHAGTLDPDATGVLVVATGRATRYLRYLVSDRKAYDFELVLGSATNTDDASGEVIATSDASGVTRVGLEAATLSFLGRQEQVPPAFSAVHVDGKRAYALARAGEQVELAPRPVDILALEVRGFEAGRAQMHMECGAGTYVRSLARDLGLALGTHGHATSIRRTRSGEFELGQCTPLAQILESPDAFVRPMFEMLAHLPVRALSDEELVRMRLGQFVLESGPDEQAVVLRHEDMFVGVGRWTRREGTDVLKPERMW
jgi:tRNA pseudouridine55 synthase